MKQPNVGDTIGVIRFLDDLGRVVFPKEQRKSLGVKEGDPLEIFATKDGFFVRKVKEEKKYENIEDKN